MSVILFTIFFSTRRRDRAEARVEKRDEVFESQRAVLNFSYTLFNIINRYVVFVKKFDGKIYIRILYYFSFFFFFHILFVSQDLISAVGWWMTVACYARGLYTAQKGRTKKKIIRIHKKSTATAIKLHQTTILIDEHVFGNYY